MASTEISAITALISGKAPPAAHATTFAAAETITIYGPSVGDIDFNTLKIRIANASAASINCSLDASDDFSGYSLGDYAFVVATSGTVYLGGEDFEAARFKHIGTGGTVSVVINIVAPAAVGCSVEAVQGPYGHTG